MRIFPILIFDMREKIAIFENTVGEENKFGEEKDKL